MHGRPLESPPEQSGERDEARRGRGRGCPRWRRYRAHLHLLSSPHPSLDQPRSFPAARLPTTARRASPPLSCSPPSPTANRHPSHRPSSPPRFPLPATSRAHCAVPALLPCRPPNAPAALAALDLLCRQPPTRLPCRPSSPTGYWSCSSRQKSERERKGEERKKRVC